MEMIIILVRSSGILVEVFHKYHYTKQKSFELVVSENKISKDLANLKQKSPCFMQNHNKSMKFCREHHKLNPAKFSFIWLTGFRGDDVKS